jgi:3-oxoacyl-[acyl-carrier protein] reductase
MDRPATTSRTVLVTGSSSGIGAATCARFQSGGMRVLGLDRVPPLGSAFESLDCDVSDSSSVAAAVRTIVERHGGFDCVVHCAGIVRDAVLWKMSDLQWDEVLRVNLTGTFKILRETIPVLRQRGGGAIVLLSSVNGLRGKFGQANYAASKAGVIALMRTAAVETGRFGIRVNAIAPGMVDTAMTRALPPHVTQEAVERAPLARVGTAAEIAEAAWYLCSDAASYITGEVLRVDGGLLT